MTDDGGRHDDRPGAKPEADAARKAILARRAKFVTMALAGAGLAMAQACKDKARVCLEIEQVPPPSASPVPCLTEVAPGPCLEAPMPEPMPPDAGAGGSGVDAAKDAGTPPPMPKACLRVAPPPPPRVCLSPKKP